MKRFYTLYILLAVAVSVFSQNLKMVSPKYEVRAVWLTTIGGLDWPRSLNAEQQKRQLCEILDQLKRANVNTVLFQARIRATTIYPSAYEPFDACLTGHAGRSPGYDPLQFAVEECHRRGMEIHAWMVCIPIGKWNGAGCRNLRSGSLPIRKIGDEGFMDPEKEQTARYIADMCEEVMRNYDIDGVHLDYIRYPETWKITVNKNVGRDHITRIVRTIHQRVKSLKPWVKISCSPIGKSDDLSRYSSRGWNAYSRVCQDAQGWLRDGLMDQLYPMMYFKDNNFFPFAIDWAENAHGRTVVSGLGIYFLSPSEGKWVLSDISRQMHVARQVGLGHAYFRSRFFTDNTKGVYDFAARQFDATPALVPPMTWERQSVPAAPRRIEVSESNGTTVLTWESRGRDLLYNVYASMTCPVDITDARNLIATRLQNNRLSVAKAGLKGGRYFAVTAMNRFGTESAPAFYGCSPGADEQSSQSLNAFLPTDGNTLQLPPIKNILDIKYLVVEDLTGRIVSTRATRLETIDISTLPEGIYVLRSVNRKGVSHRLGYFVRKGEKLRRLHGER
ncbi:MAG: family 10 glycosylhydrolase [Prevotella sp.]|nr:family 10 glycosylhydrolase [Prevotella sp.]